ncbi:hypothetical protein D9M68_678070 [compost metagenome]
MVERLRQLRQIGRALAGQRQRMPPARKHRLAEPRLKLAHLMADGGLSDAQLARGAGETQVPGSGLEGTQRSERRQASHDARLAVFMKRMRIDRFETAG